MLPRIRNLLPAAGLLLAGTLFEKKPVKPGGFRDRLQKRVELAQQMAADKQAEMQRQSGQKKSYKKRK